MKQNSLGASASRKPALVASDQAPSGLAPTGVDPARDLRPVMLCGLTWKQALASLKAVDCALRRPHWCSPVVVMVDGHLMLDDDGELHLYRHYQDDARARDWMMIPRVDDDGNEIEPDYRWKPQP